MKLWKPAKSSTSITNPRECFCVGPQDGQPQCPCRMATLEIIDGRYIERRDDIDQGPVQ